MKQSTWPIFLIGAGGIVRNAHLPAYKQAGYLVGGIYDVDAEKAGKLAAEFAIEEVCRDMDELLSKAGSQAIFDIAVPAAELIDVLSKLPGGSFVLMQKPMGENLEQAKKILEICRKNKLVAAVNFQLRYAPFIIEARKMIQRGELGELTDVEVNVNVHTPWQLWDFLYHSERVEILYHSIHYIDLVRSFLGEPQTVYAKTHRHPAMKQLASVKSNIIMDYGDWLRVSISTNHCHDFGSGEQESYIKFEGTGGAIKIRLGLLKNYPNGEKDEFLYILKDGEELRWKSMDIKGSWFPDAFAGSMSEIIKAASGKIERPDNSVEDCIHTMACVEAAYRSSRQGGVKPGEV